MLVVVHIAWIVSVRAQELCTAWSSSSYIRQATQLNCLYTRLRTVLGLTHAHSCWIF